MTFDALSALRTGGHWVDVLSAEQRAVLETLSEEEVDVLNRVKRRLDAAAPDVQGQDLKIL
ncbi:aroma-sacti cluster domain-containing protein [Nonomuraea sp. NPDC050643]|uniref:aroma-sacti cluster domain-containing protein n=1 Tax=Nonomuraea sp. NPDC050643 TaxID=3155660 RepID=UPI0033D9858D